jgi:hypothetical protein
MRRHSLSFIGVIFIVLAILPPSGGESGESSPIILIYSGEETDWGNRLAELIRADDRFDAEILLVDNRPTYETVVNFPRIQAVILCPLTKERATMADVSDLTAAYFLDGGAVVGMGSAPTSRYAPRVGPEVFSIVGNRSIPSKKIEGRRVFTYQKLDVISEINGATPQTLNMEGYLAFYSSNVMGEYVEIPANGTRHVLYEGDKNAPLMVAFQSDAGGSSVAFPGLTVQAVEGKDNYYGLLLERQEFRDLFLNGLKWAIDNSPRYERLRTIAGPAMEAEASRRADLAAEADKLQSRIENRRLMRLAVLWGVGLAFCAGVALKFVIVGGEGEEE